MKKLILPVLILLLFARQTPAQHSPGEARRIVAGWYERFLGREPDPPSQVWVDKLMRGWRDGIPHAAAHVLAEILSTPEYYNRAGGTQETYINHLYFQLTGSRPSPRVLRYWVNFVYHPQGHNVAYDMLLRYSPGGNAGRPSWERYRDRDREYEYHRPYWRDGSR